MLLSQRFFIAQQNFIKALVCVCMMSGSLDAMELVKQRTDAEKEAIVTEFINYFVLEIVEKK